MRLAMALLCTFVVGVCSSSIFAQTPKPETAFKDCDQCPSMVKVPAGTFMMGSSAAETTREGLDQKLAERERPPHAVRITRAFALGQFAVTRGEFAAFSQDTGHDPSGCYIFANGNFVLDQNRSWRNPGFEQTDRHPVVCVSHEDAQRYVQWLSRRTGKSYRLPAEAEWEYSARAGTTTARFWGDGRDQACNFANVADLTGAAVLNWDKSDKDRVFQCRDGYAYTAPVGSFRPNAFGLYDMLGNVWQGTEDCYHDSYSGAPNDASAWVGGECKNRVLRGGSWALAPRELRAAERIRGGSGDRDFYSGFRVGRALSP